MCALFESSVTICQVRLTLDPTPGEVAIRELSAKVRVAERLTVRDGQDAQWAVASPRTVPAALPRLLAQVHDWQPEVFAPPAAVHTVTWPPFRVALRLPAVPPLIAPIRAEPAITPPAVHSNLEAALAQPVRRRLVPADRLSSEVVDHWLRRLADAKKMAKPRLQLVGIFPGVQIAEDTEVRHQAINDTISYQLPASPVQPSTIVVARRTDTDVSVVGRFYS